LFGSGFIVICASRLLAVTINQSCEASSHEELRGGFRKLRNRSSGARGVFRTDRHRQAIGLICRRAYEGSQSICLLPNSSFILTRPQDFYRKFEAMNDDQPSNSTDQLSEVLRSDGRKKRLFRAQWRQRKRLLLRALVIFAGAALPLVVGAFWYVRKERQEAERRDLAVTRPEKQTLKGHAVTVPASDNRSSKT
jgi:hypothetical protein